MKQKPRILIVDDQESRASFFIEELKAAEPNWIFVPAASMADALGHINKQLKVGEPFAVVIADLDLRERGQSGFELIKAVQELDPLVMTILYTFQPAILKLYRMSGLGAFDVVVKGKGDAIDIERILERTRTALQYRSEAVRVRFLRRYFAPQFWDTIDRNPSLLDPKSRDLTVAFWDIRGFSSLCDILREDPPLVAGFLKEYCDLAAKTILDNGGLVDKFIGDGVMALFGFFDQSDAGRRTGAKNAVHAAQAMLAAFNPLVQSWMPKWWRPAQVIEIRLACGIHTGRALVGNLGTDFRDQFTAVGPHVNFAQRLESLAGKEPDSEILISASTLANLDSSFTRRSGSGSEGDNGPTVSFFKEINDVKNIPGTYRIYKVACSPKTLPVIT